MTIIQLYTGFVGGEGGLMFLASYSFIVCGCKVVNNMTISKTSKSLSRARFQFFLIPETHKNSLEGSQILFENLVGHQSNRMMMNYHVRPGSISFQEKKFCLFVLTN